MNTNTNIKQGYKQTSLGILPQEWEVVHLGEVFQVSSGATPLRQNKLFWENPTIQWVKIGDLNNSFIISTEEKISLLALKKTTCKLLPKNTLLIAMYGGFNQIGRTGILSIEATTNQAISALIPKNNKISPIFVNACLLLNKEKWKEFAISSRKDPNITKTDIEKFQIPLPPLAEQEKIAQILGVWDKGISVLKSLIEAKTKHKKALMQRLLTPPTHPLTPSAREGEQKSHHDTKAPPLAGGVGVGYSHIENNRNDDKVLDCHDLTASNLAMTEKNSKAKQSLRFAEFTDKWQEFRFNDIFIRIPSKKYQIQTKEYQLNGKYPVIDQGQTAIIGYSNNESKVFKNSSVIVFGDHTRELKFIDFDFIAGADGVQLLRTKDEFNDRFFYYQLQIKKIPNTGYNRHFKFLLDMPFVCPTLTEQKKIAQVLSACDKEIELLKSKFQCLKTQKKGLMQRLLNGEVRVKC